MKKKHPESVPLSSPAPEVNGVYSGLRPILHPSGLEIRHPTNQQSDTGEHITSLAEIKISPLLCNTKVSLKRFSLIQIQINVVMC